MPRALRLTLLAVSAVQVFLAVAFLLRLQLVVSVWPFAGTTPLTYTFLASICAAAATSTLWTVFTRNHAALAGIGLDAVAILGPIGLLALRLASSGTDPRMSSFGVICLVGAALGLALLLHAIRIPLDVRLRTPQPVLWSMVAFVVALVYVSYRLIAQQLNVIPWSITPDLSLLIGFTFLGAAFYFAYGVLRPYWSNAGGQLAGFLAYDLVLILPFLQRLPTVAPEHRTSLVVYIAVVAYSGLLAINYLFVHRTTRFGGGRS